jgi:RNA-binding protein NOB1
MNLNLLSTTTLQRIKHLKTYIKRCHACFFTTKEMHKQFCPRCGKDSLTRVSCSTNANGQFTLHLKKNMQWNTRGSRYSIPKPVHGNASGKWKSGGGKGGWGTELILTEDQKEYARAMVNEQRQARKERNLMDEDYLPSILTGERQRTGGRIKVGAGRNVNSKKR